MYNWSAPRRDDETISSIKKLMKDTNSHTQENRQS